MMTMYAMFVAVILFLHGAHGFSSGGPTSVCDTLSPSHGVAPQNFIKYALDVSAEQITAGQTVQVTIYGNGDFKGFFLVAKDRLGNSIGEFAQSNQYQTKQCRSNLDNAITHRDSSLKPSVTATWRPQPGFKGEMFFRATVVESYNQIFMNVESNSVQVV